MERVKLLDDRGTQIHRVAVDERDRLVVQFEQPTRWIAVTPEEASRWAEMFLRYAAERQVVVGR